MRREFVIWGVTGAIVVVALGMAVFVLNSTLYSASGFVGSYLSALERKDADAALELVGASVSGDASRELLVRDAIGELSDIQLVGETEAAGTHQVTYSYLAGDVAAQSTFDVRGSGALFGLFATWDFVDSPFGVMHVNALNDPRFSANGVELISPTPNDPAPYLVFAPGTLELDHETRWLEASAVTVTISEPGRSVPTAVIAVPNEDFVAEVQRAVNAHLEQCTTQSVLLPTGCPFGRPVSNRIVSPPIWTMVTFPVATIEPTDTAGEWSMPATAGTAHVVVDVKSLFDGTVTTVDEDVPFTARYRIVVLPNDQVLVTPLVD